MKARTQPLRALGDADPYRLSARLAFLQTVEALAPHVVRELEEQIYPRFTALAGRFGGRIDCATLDQLAPVLPEAESLREALAAWAAEYHLHRDAWIVEAALRYVHAYSPDKADRIPFGSIGSVAYWVPATNPAPQYRPDIETLRQYEQRQREYIASVEAQFAQQGWARSTDRNAGSAHMEWLVRFQVLKASYSKIAKKGDVSTVRKAIKSLAKFLPLALRTERGQATK